MQQRSIIVLVILACLLIGCADYSASTTPTPTGQAAPTLAPTATKEATHVSSQIPAASDLSQLISQVDGKVTDVNTTANSNGTSNVAVDVTVNSPTQARVKHISFELAQFFFQRSDVSVVNFVFHASGYTGMDDPIAGSGGVAPSNWLGMDESQLWDAMAGVFNANLPA